MKKSQINGTLQEIDDNKVKMEYAITAIKDNVGRNLNYRVFTEKSLENIVFGNEIKGSYNPLSDIKELVEWKYDNSEKFNSLIMDLTFDIHNNWIIDNVSKFSSSDEKYKYMPSELLGWDKTKENLSYVKSIFESAGMQLDEQDLEQEYNKRVMRFFLRYCIENSKDLEKNIKENDAFFYRSEEVKKEIQNNPEMVGNIVSLVEQQGIGKIERVRKEIVVPQVIKDPRKLYITRLSKHEQKDVMQSLKNEVVQLEDKKVALIENNDIVDRIIKLAKIRNDLNKAIQIEENRRTTQIHSLDD